jgi:hypothetical protein
MTYSQSIPRDANFVPVTTWGFQASKVLTINASNTTVNPPIFTLTGSVLLTALYGVITTDLSSAHTAAYWRLNDQTAQVNITLNTGTTLSSKKAGSVIAKKGLVGAALSLIDNVAGAVSEPTTLETAYFSPILLLKKTAATTQIEYVYTTTNTPATGEITFFVNYQPLSSDGALVAV